MLMPRLIATNSSKRDISTALKMKTAIRQHPKNGACG